MISTNTCQPTRYVTTNLKLLNSFKLTEQTKTHVEEGLRVGSYHMLSLLVVQVSLMQNVHDEDYDFIEKLQ